MNSKTHTLLLGAVALLAASATPAGPHLPMILRDVTMGGTTGPAYYSIVERGYRFVARNGHVEERIAAVTSR